MNITIVTTKKFKKLVPVLEDDGKTQKKVKGVPQTQEVDSVEEIEHVFETHEHELAGSAAQRAVKEIRYPTPPAGRDVTLVEYRDGGAALIPGHAIGKAYKDKKFRLSLW
jgi:hypothetical protein